MLFVDANNKDKLIKPDAFKTLKDWYVGEIINKSTATNIMDKVKIKILMITFTLYLLFKMGDYDSTKHMLK